MVPWANPSRQPKRHLDQFILFRRARGCVQQTRTETSVARGRMSADCTACMRCGLETLRLLPAGVSACCSSLSAMLAGGGALGGEDEGPCRVTSTAGRRDPAERSAVVSSQPAAAAASETSVTGGTGARRGAASSACDSCVTDTCSSEV